MFPHPPTIACASPRCFAPPPTQLSGTPVRRKCVMLATQSGNFVIWTKGGWREIIESYYSAPILDSAMGDRMNARGSAFSRRLRAGVALRALAAGSAWAGDLPSGDNPGARIGTRYPSRRLTAAFAALGLTVVAPASSAHAQASPLGTAASFGVLAGSTVTNTGAPATVITGNVGVSPGTAVTGFFPPGIVTPPFTIHTNDGVAIQAQSDLSTAFTALSGGSFTPLTGQTLGVGAAQTLTAGHIALVRRLS